MHRYFQRALHSHQTRVSLKEFRFKAISRAALGLAHRKQKLNYHILYLVILTKKIFNYIIFPLKRESLFISHLDFSLKQLRKRLGEREIGSRIHFHVRSPYSQRWWTFFPKNFKALGI